MKALKLTAFAVIITTCLASAEWIDLGMGGNEAGIAVLEQSNSHTTFEVRIPGLNVYDAAVDGAEYRRIRVPGASTAKLAAGGPELPVVPVLLAVPTGADVDLGDKWGHNTIFIIRSVSRPIRAAGCLCVRADSF